MDKFKPKPEDIEIYEPVASGVSPTRIGPPIKIEIGLAVLDNRRILLGEFE